MKENNKGSNNHLTSLASESAICNGFRWLKATQSNLVSRDETQAHCHKGSSAQFLLELSSRGFGFRLLFWRLYSLCWCWMKKVNIHVFRLLNLVLQSVLAGAIEHTRNHYCLKCNRCLYQKRSAWLTNTITLNIQSILLLLQTNVS